MRKKHDSINRRHMVALSVAMGVIVMIVAYALTLPYVQQRALMSCVDNNLSQNESNTENVPRKTPESSPRKKITVTGHVFSGENFTLEVPAELEVRASEMRIQSYPISSDYMPSEGFFMYISAAEDDGMMAMSNATTVSTKYLERDVVRGDGCGLWAGECGGIVRSYYFGGEGVRVSIFAHDVAGRNAAEKVLENIVWK